MITDIKYRIPREHFNTPKTVYHIYVREHIVSHSLHRPPARGEQIGIDLCEV